MLAWSQLEGFVRFGVPHLKKGYTQLETARKRPLEKAEPRKHNPLAKSERNGCSLALGETGTLPFMPLAEETARTGPTFQQRRCRLDPTQALPCRGRGCREQLSGLLTAAEEELGLACLGSSPHAADPKAGHGGGR